MLSLFLIGWKKERKCNGKKTTRNVYLLVKCFHTLRYYCSLPDTSLSHSPCNLKLICFSFPIPVKGLWSKALILFHLQQATCWILTECSVLIWDSKQIFDFLRQLRRLSRIAIRSWSDGQVGWGMAHRVHFRVVFYLQC